MDHPKGYKAIILDLDGTLLNTLDDLAGSHNRVLVRHGFPTHPVDAYRYFVGDGAAKCMTRALPEDSRDGETVRLCLAECRADYARNWNIETRPYEGIAEMLDTLSARGIKLAVVSNKPQADTDRCMAEFLSSWRFEMVLGQRESLPPKPDPTGALEVATKLAVAPEKFLFLGDTSVDMQTAVSAGMFPVGALWGFRTVEELRESGAGEVIERPIDLVALLG